MRDPADAPADDEPEVFYLWPENVRTWALWQSVQTQWRSSGMGGREGLDYAGVELQMQHLRVRPKDRRRTRSEIQLMERTALRVWAERRAAAGG